MFSQSIQRAADPATTNVPGLFEHKGNSCIYYIVEDRTPSVIPSMPGAVPQLLAVMVFDATPQSERSRVIHKPALLDFKPFYGEVSLEQTR